MGPSPSVVIDDHHRMTIQWPFPKPLSFEISSEVFESMVDDLNELRAPTALIAWDDTHGDAAGDEVTG